MSASYYARVMNIPCDALRLPDVDSMSMGDAYRLGHRDARDAAAEIANEADATIRDYAAIVCVLRTKEARWEPGTNEFCIGGMRYSTTMDDNGVPVITSGMRVALIRALGKG